MKRFSYVCRLSIFNGALQENANEPVKQSGPELSFMHLNYNPDLCHSKFMQLSMRDLDRVTLFLNFLLHPKAQTSVSDTGRGGPTEGPCVLLMRFETGVSRTIPFDFVRFGSLPTRVGLGNVAHTSTLLLYGRTCFVFMEERSGELPESIAGRMRIIPMRRKAKSATSPDRDRQRESLIRLLRRNDQTKASQQWANVVRLYRCAETGQFNRALQ